MLKFEENLASRVSGALQPMLGVQVTVTAKNGLLATLYADDESAVLTNPLTTDANGYFGFKAANGEYTLTFAGAQIEASKRNIELYDADDDPPLTLSQAAAPTAASRIGYQPAGEGSTPRTVENKLGETISAKDKGAMGDGVTDDAPSIEAAVVEVHPSNDVVVLPVGTYDVTAATPNIHKAHLFGAGALKGAYRKPVVRALDSAWVASSNFSVSAHAPRLLTANRPKVVLVGDSIASFTSISVTDKADNLEYMLRAKLREACPKKEIDFVNRSVGGKRYYDLGRDEAVDLSGYDWYAANPGRPWMEYIKDQNPDVVFLSFGMNDGANWMAGNFQPNATFAVVEKLRALPKVPDIVFCTNILPSLSAADPNYSSKDMQEGRDAVAGFIRSWAEMMGCGYLDFNRAANALRDGRDIMDCYLERQDVNVGGSFPITSSIECRDYSLWFRINGYPADFLANGLTFKLSPHPNNFLVLSTSGGFFRVIVYTQGGGYRQYEELTNVAAPLPGTSPVFEFSLSRNRVELLIDGVAIFKGPVIRYGGSFVPVVTYTGTAVAPLTRTLLTGVERPYKPRVSDFDIYRAEHGGNGINHVNAMGARVFFAEVIDKANWHAPASAFESSARALQLLAGHNGMAIDFASRQFVIRSSSNPELNKAGLPESIITMVRGAALEYVTDAASGERIGIRCQGNLGYIPLAMLPPMGQEFTVIVDAYQEATGVQNVLFAVSRDPDNGFRAYGRITNVATTSMVSYDDAGVVSANIFGSTTFPLNTTRFNRYGFSFKNGDMKLIANGQRTYGNAAKSGVLPTSLTRFRIGHESAAADQSPMVIRSIVLIPRAVSHTELIALSF